MTGQGKTLAPTGGLSTRMLTPADKRIDDDGRQRQTVVACAQCGEGLLRGDRTWRCPRCRRSYPALPGVVRISPQPRYAGDVPQETMQAVLERARDSSWLDATNIVKARHGPAAAERIVGVSAGDWFPEVPWRRGMRVLDIGSGWGQLAFRLCRYVKEVYSLEPVAQLADFQQIRRRQEQAENVTIVNSQLDRLPFRAESFDLIALKQILEVIGASDPSQRPTDLQRIFLGQVRRLLKPEGAIYLAGTNRLACWRGSNHKGGARACIHSPGGYRELLREAGLLDMRICWVLPSCEAPLASARFGDARALSFFARWRGRGSIEARAKSLLLRAAARAGASTFVMPNLAVVACANGRRRRSLLERICDRLGKNGISVRADRCLRCSPRRRSLTGRIKAKALHLLFDSRSGRPVMVAKVPRGLAGMRWLQREERAFGAIAGRCPHLQQARRALYMRVGDIRVLCERFFPGRSFSQHPRRPRAQSAVMSWLSAMHRQAATSGGQALSVAACAEAVVDRLIAHDGIEPEVARYLRQWLDAISRRRRLRVRSVPVHGDFTPDNVLLSGRETFVTDWDQARPAGGPWEDFWTFQLSCAFNTSGNESAESAHAPNALACLAGANGHWRVMAAASAQLVEEAGIPREALVGGLLPTIVRRALIDLDLRGLGPTGSRYYQLLRLAAGDGIALWDCADRIVSSS